jgi:hypothetical protein
LGTAKVLCTFSGPHRVLLMRASPQSDSTLLPEKIAHNFQLIQTIHHNAPPAQRGCLILNG